VHQTRRLWLIVDQAGRILQRSTVRRSVRHVLRRRPGSVRNLIAAAVESGPAGSLR
jgi:hypothetical protein